MLYLTGILTYHLWDFLISWTSNHQVRSENVSGGVKIFADLERFRRFDSDTTPPRTETDRLYGLVVRVSGYRSRSLVSIPGATRFSEK
jgi:hypothetical protein